MGLNMELTLNDIISGIIGGVLIGLASALIWLTLGRIAGISGILSKLFSLDYKQHAWRISFVVGLLAGGLLFSILFPLPEPLITMTGDNSGLAIIGGLLVGFGAVYGSGCTSGHGVCGLSRLSKRSFTAVGLFILCGMITVTLLHIINNRSLL